MICFIYDLHHEHHDRNRLLEKPAELRHQHHDLGRFANLGLAKKLRDAFSKAGRATVSKLTIYETPERPGAGSL
jgi:hypothetical protein